MLLKAALSLIWLIALVAPAISQDDQVKLTTQSAPALRIVSAPVQLDRDGRKVTLSLELENTGDKTIKSFGWTYRTRGVIRGYNVTITSEMPEVSVVLAPNEKKKVVLLDKSDVRDSILDMPFKEIAVTSVVFEDGSSWKRKDEK